MDHIIDAQERPLGRVATEAARLLQGKQSASYQRNRLPSGERVVVKNASKIRVTGTKATGKRYVRHTGYTGHLKIKTFEQAFGKSPENVVLHAIRGMLPKNTLRRVMLKWLVIEK
ncbi:MAG: 50S ribosomal protein L13 [Candidatus Liptonbacteria bacterium]|nr:50S ribosomal protein L13 [Candidatus Liptonbacteria bacterium]